MGCGFISGDFIEAMKLLPADHNKVVAIGSKSLERCKEFQKKHDLPHAVAYGSYEEFVKDPNIDIVYIGTRNNQHKDNIVLCAKAKKNVLCEKPMGLNKAEVEESFSVAKENGVFLQEAFWSRFFPVYKGIRKTLDEGKVGEVQIVQADLGFPILEKMERLYKPELGGGMALDLGCYLAQFALFVFGKDTPIETIRTVGWTKHDVDDTAGVVIKFQGHKMASLVYSGTVHLKCAVQICGTKGRIEIPENVHSPAKYVVTTANDDGKPEEKEYQHKLPDADMKKFHFPTSNGFTFEIEGVRKHLLEGHKECCPELKEGESVKIAEILDSIREQLGLTP